MNRRILFAALAGSLFAGSVMAQTAPTPARLRGKIDAVHADSLEMTLRNGSKATVKLPAELRVTWLLVAEPGDIKENSYIGTVTVPAADGTFRALEVQVFPAAMRGVGEGSREWDLMPQSMMTNGTVGSMTVAEGRTITLNYKDGMKKVFIPKDVPIVTYEPANREALTVGANILLNGTRAADGTVTATNVNVGKNGLVPPM